MKCPICKQELEEERYTEETWGSFDVVEVHQKCSNCKMYQYEYTYGNSCRWIYKRTICDDKQHRFYTSLIKILWKLGVITNEYNNIYDKTQKL